MKACLASLGKDSHEFALQWDHNHVFYNADRTEAKKLRHLLGGFPDCENMVLTLENLFDNTEIGFMRIKAIQFTKYTLHMNRSDTITCEGIAKAIMQDVLENTSSYLEHNGSITTIQSE